MTPALLDGIFGVKFPVRDLAVSQAWYEQVLVFHDPDGLEIHLYSRERHGQDMSINPAAAVAFRPQDDVNVAPSDALSTVFARSLPRYSTTR